MYWSVIGDHSHIEESAMDGSMRRVLLDKNLRRPTGMFLYFWFLFLLWVLNCFSVSVINERMLFWFFLKGRGQGLNAFVWKLVGLASFFSTSQHFPHFRVWGNVSDAMPLGKPAGVFLRETLSTATFNHGLLYRGQYYASSAALGIHHL